MSRHFPQRPHRHQTGLTLVELLVSITLGLLIVAGLIALLVSLNRNNDELTKSDRMISSGRIAIQLLESDLVHAGYWGGHIPRFDDLINAAIPNDVPSAVPDPCLGYGANWDDQYKTNLVGIPLHSYEVTNPVPTPPIPVCAAAGTGPVQNPTGNSDVIVVRYAQKCGADCLTAVPVGNVPVYMQVQRCGNTLASLTYNIAQSGFAFQNVRCNAAAEVRRLVSHIYYVSVVNGIPTLMRSEFGVSGGVPAHETAQPLVEGIQAIRIEYGLDQTGKGGAVDFTKAIEWQATGGNGPLIESIPRFRGDGVADVTGVRCTSAVPCTVAQLMNVVTAQIYVLARSDAPTPGYVDNRTYQLGSVSAGPFNDNFRRQVFTQTVRLVNVSSRRETP